MMGLAEVIFRFASEIFEKKPRSSDKKNQNKKSPDHIKPNFNY